MSPDIDILLQAWGAWSRDHSRLGYGETPIARMIRAHIEQNAPVRRNGGCSIPDQIGIAVDQAVARLDHRLQRVCVVWYVQHLPVHAAIQRLGMSRSSLYRHLAMIQRQITADLRSGK